MRKLTTLLISLLFTLTLLVGCGGGDEKEQSSEEATTEATTTEATTEETTTLQAAQENEKKGKQEARKKDIQKEQVSGQEEVAAVADRALEKQDTSNIPPLPPEEADARRACLLAKAETVPPEQLQRTTNVIIAMANERGVTPEELVGC